MVGVAILGAGIFAREQHIPALEELPGLDLKAIYSRSRASAESLLTALTTTDRSTVDTYYDKDDGGPGQADPSKSLDSLLARPDVAAVIVCLPINAQPAVIKRALSAGKHVISEKPIAKDVAAARDLIAWYDGTLAVSPKPAWAVAENFRYTESFELAADKVREVGGDVVSFNLGVFTLVKEDSKYYNTAWRKTPDYQGGFLLDGGVHFVAALRLLLAAAGHDISRISARSALLQPRLLPVDTVHGVLATDKGAGGTLAISFGTEFKAGFECQVVTTEGSVTASPGHVEIVRRGREPETIKFEKKSSVKAELEAFGESLRRGAGPGAAGGVVVHERQTVGEALRDLEVLQALLESGEAGGELRVI